MLEELEQLKQACEACNKCSLSETRTNVVFHRGEATSRIMLVAEAPGQEEDLSGLPLVGKAGKYLHSMFSAVGLDTRKDLYLCNVLKCRPPNNRPPEDEEAAACSPWLEQQIEIIKPKLIVALGNTALKYFSGATGITKMRGKWMEYKGTPYMPIYHPSYLMRQEWKKNQPNSPHRQAWTDLQAIKAAVETECLK